MIRLDLQSRRPIYEQLREKISELVILGELEPDEQLPSVRNFARELGVNPNTVQKAYQELERDGIVYSVAGRGSYISADSGAAAHLREQRLGQVRLAAGRAKSCGLPEDAVLGAVKEIYGRKEDGAK